MFADHASPTLEGDFRIAIGESFGAIDELRTQCVVAGPAPFSLQESLGVCLCELPLRGLVNMLLVNFFRQPLCQGKITFFDGERVSFAIFNDT